MPNSSINEFVERIFQHLQAHEVIDFLNKQKYVPENFTVTIDEAKDILYRICIEYELFPVAFNFPDEQLWRVSPGVLGKRDLLRNLFLKWNIPNLPTFTDEATVGYYKDKLNEYNDKLDKHIRLNQLEAAHADLINAWAYVDKLLKMILIFYQKIFWQFSDALLDYAFGEAIKERNWDARLEKIAEIELLFKKGETSSQRDNRIKKEVNSSQDKAYERQRLEFARQLQMACWFRWGRKSPFEDLNIKDIKKSVKNYRNPPAHDSTEDIWKEKGSKYVREGWKAANDVVLYIKELKLCPITKFPICSGNDLYGRHWVGFLDEETLAEVTYLKEKSNLGDPRLWHNAISWYYFKTENNFEMLTAYLTIEHPLRASGIYDPWMVPRNEVLSVL